MKKYRVTLLPEKRTDLLVLVSSGKYRYTKLKRA